MSGHIPLPSIPGQLSISSINSYLGAPATSERKLSTEASSAPNWSLAQIFNSEYGSTTIPNVGNPSLPRFRMSDLYARTFGIYMNTDRTMLHGNTYQSGMLPAFIGYLGFGTSGMFNPINRGFPVKVIIDLFQGDSREIDVAYNTTDQLNWIAVPLGSGPTSFVAPVTAIRMLGNSLSESIINLTVYPCLDGSTSGTGRHRITITMPGEDIRPPIDEDPQDGPGGDEIIDRPPNDGNLR